jgi:hypothetical protein
MDTTRIEDVRVEMIKPLTDSSRREMGMGNRQRTGVIKLVRMPVMASFTPTITSTLPYAYTFDAKAAAELRPILAQHGVRIEQLTAPATVTAETFHIDSIVDRGQSESARRMRDAPGAWTTAATRTLPTGTYIVRASQPFGLLAFYLLEPQGDDGLLQWGFFEPIIPARTATPVDYPVQRIVKPATLRTSPVGN